MCIHVHVSGVAMISAYIMTESSTLLCVATVLIDSPLQYTLNFVHVHKKAMINPFWCFLASKAM